MSIPRSCLKSDRRKPASCYKDSVLPHSTMRDCIMDLHWKPSLCLVFLALSGSFIWSVGVSLNVCNYMGHGAFSTVSLIYMVSSLFEKLMGFCNTLLTLQWSRRSPHVGRHSLFSPVFPLHSLLQSGVLHESTVTP